MPLRPVSLLWSKRFYVVPEIIVNSKLPYLVTSNKRPSIEGHDPIAGRISYNRITSIDIKTGVPITETEIKFFCSPHENIKQGSYIIHNPVTGDLVYYKYSGFPAIYNKHMELILERVEIA